MNEITKMKALLKLMFYVTIHRDSRFILEKVISFIKNYYLVTLTCFVIWKLRILWFG